MTEEGKVNWVSVINFLEVCLSTLRHSILKSASGKNNGSTKKKLWHKESIVLKQRYDQTLLFVKI